MKLTILSKCFNKMKRVALTLFAVLCVGNVWAATFAGDIQNLSFDAETKTISFKWNCYLYDTVNSYKVKAILEYGGSTVTEKVTTKEFVSGRWYVMKFDKTLDDFNLGDVLRVTFSLCYGNSDANVDNTWGDDSFTYTIDTRGVLTSECLWDVDTKKFLLSGKVAGDGIKGVKVKYKISDAELAELPEDAVVENAEFDSVASTYKIQIPYVNEKSYLNWSVYAVFDDEEKIFKDPSTEKEVLSERQNEDGYVAYTWVGGDENNLWSNPLNWDENLKRSLKGVPGYVNYAGHHTSIACFTNSATVNLGGGTYRLYDYEGDNIPHRALRFIKGDNENMVVKFTNGNLQINDGEGDNSNPLLGADGVTVEFADGGIYKYPYQLAFAPGTTIIFSGNSTQPWKYNPANKGEGATTFIVRNGNVLSSYSADGDASATHTAIIENGVWMINEVVSRGIANVTKFVDGENQAKIALGANANGKTKTLKLTGTFEFTFAENQMSKAAYILPHSLVDGSQNATFKVDATAYKSGAKVPMVAVAVATDFIPKLQVFANGVDVTSDRNAKLVWEGTTLYFQQDSQNAASIGTTEYATLGEALEAATAGATIKVLNDCTADTAYVIANKTLTIDLNGKTVKANDTAAATDGNGVFWVQAGGVLTLEDSSEDKTGTVDGNGGNDYKMAIWADGGKVVINAGNYVNDNDGTQNQYDLIYVKNGGEIVINGGTFKCDSPRWTLNSHNTKTGTFVVTGGKFYQYNPTDFDTDEAVTTWCDAKYRAELDEDGWYVIKEGYTVTTEPEASAVTVTADTEAEALEQVEFSVTAPEGVDATAYENYFKLVATETAEGSKTWIVALALKDELKPVIAETTPAITFNENGTVTVNIENELPGLNYGVRYATTVEAVETATPVAGFTVTPAAGDTAGFFKVVVDFKPIPEAE